MPHHDKLKGLEKELDRLGLDEEVQSVGKLKMKMDPIELAMMFAGLNPEIWHEECDEEGCDEDEPQEDSVSDIDNDDFDYAHFGLGSSSRQDKKSATERAKEQHRIHVGGLRVKAKFELDQLLELIDDCEAAGDPYEELEDLRSRLKSAQMLYAKYDREYVKLNKKPKPAQSNDARDFKGLEVIPPTYKYDIGQSVLVYETAEDSFPAEIIGRKLDSKTGHKTYRVIKPDGTKAAYPEFRIWLDTI